MKKWLSAWFIASAFSVPVQAVSLTELEGSPFATEQQMQGKVVLVDFWASWCGPCRKSFPWLNQLQQKHGAQGLVILAVNEDQDRQEAQRFLAAYPANFAVLYDQQGALAEKYQLSGMPGSYLIDKKGTIRFVHRGFKQATLAEYEAQIDHLLAEE